MRGTKYVKNAVFFTAASAMAAILLGSTGLAEDASGVYTAVTDTIEKEYVSFEYPVLNGVDGYDQAVVDAINQNFREDAEKNAEAEYENMVSMHEELLEYNPEAADLLAFEVTCESMYIEQNLFSVQQFYYSYSGGVHGYSFPVGHTYDLTTGKELTLAELLGCDETTAEEAVVEAYRQKIIGQVENITEESIRSCVSDLEYWMEADGVYLNIPPYTIASYAAGQQQAVITPEILETAKKSPHHSSQDSHENSHEKEHTSEYSETIPVINGIQADAADFIFPYSSEVLLAEPDLTKLEGSSVEEEHYRSQLAINEILARYGYVFHPENGGASKEAYDQFEGRAWYEEAKPYCPSASANDMLYQYINSTELSNIELICEWQKAHNCYY